MPTTAVTALEHDWSVRARRAPGPAVLAALIAAEPDIAATGVRSLPELVRYISAPPDGATVAHWRVTAALIRQLEFDELVGLGVLVALRPGLLAVGRQLDWGAGG